jgi:hypothetical protein
LYCREPPCNARTREKWILCSRCLQWAHSQCAGVSPSFLEFVCELCK